MRLQPRKPIIPLAAQKEEWPALLRGVFLFCTFPKIYDTLVLAYNSCNKTMMGHSEKIVSRLQCKHLSTF